MANSITDLLVTVQNGVNALNKVAKSLTSAFPQTTSISTTIPSSVGILTFNSSQPVEFLTVILSDGTTKKLPLYNL